MKYHAGYGTNTELLGSALSSSGTGENVDSATIRTKMPNDSTVSMNI